MNAFSKLRHGRDNMSYAKRFLALPLGHARTPASADGAEGNRKRAGDRNLWINVAAQATWSRAALTGLEKEERDRFPKLLKSARERPP